MRNYTCLYAKYCNAFDKDDCQGCAKATTNNTVKKEKTTMSTHDYVMALAMNHDPATVIVGNTKIPVLITDVDSRHMANCAPETKFTCQIVNLDQILEKTIANSVYGLKKACAPAISPFDIARVYFNNPVTVVLWKDGTKTIVRCQEGDTYSEETGLALCFAKKALGNKGNFNDVFHKYIPEEKEAENND